MLSSLLPEAGSSVPDAPNFKDNVMGYFSVPLLSLFKKVLVLFDESKDIFDVGSISLFGFKWCSRGCFSVTSLSCPVSGHMQGLLVKYLSNHYLFE